VRRGIPGDVGGLADVVKSPVFSTGVGLALYGARRQAAGPPVSDVVPGQALGRWGRRILGWLSEIL
jgi:cell division ATPase FtsA